jgi:serine protease AprX
MRGTAGVVRRRGQSWIRSARVVRGLVAGAGAAILAVSAMTVPAAAADSGSRGGSTASASAAGSYIVRTVPGKLGELTRVLAGRGLRVGRRIAIIDAVVVQLPAGAADRLRSDPRVASVTPDAAVHMLTGTYSPGSDPNSLYTSESVTSVRSRAWGSGVTGQGVDVALVDSGVAPVAGLSDVGKVLNGPDLTPESQNAATRYLDTYGHGTHMAGIIAGHDSGVAVSAADTTHFLGVAPNARIVSVKVADAHGNSDVSQVIAGIDWVVQHAHDPGMNVRVLNLSFGTNSTQAYTLDPLAYAAEIAWRAGIVVVTSAGNSGAASGRMVDPAVDPYVIAVGADDTHSTANEADDTVPAFSSNGDRVRNPDLIAPGVHVQSLRIPGSYVDTQFGATGAIDARFMRGSGTSQSAAFASGMAALLLQYRPNLTPDEVKATLINTANPIPGASLQAQGGGVIDFPSSHDVVTGARQTFTRSTGLGSLEGSRGDAHVTLGGVTLSGEKDLNGQPFIASATAVAEAAGSSWTGGTWNGKTWTGSSWAGSCWASTNWSGSSWAGSSWAGSSWASGTWAGSSWASTNWSGSSWAGSSWAGSSWAGKSWADNVWS